MVVLGDARRPRLADAFAEGLEAGGVMPDDEALPGPRLRDPRTRTSAWSRSGRRRPRSRRASCRTGWRSRHGMPLMMLSNATYTAWDAARGRRLVAGDQHDPAPGHARVPGRDDHGLARRDRRVARGYPTSHLADRAATAGTDCCCVTGSEATSRGVYAALLAAAPGRPAPLRVVARVVRPDPRPQGSAELTRRRAAGRGDRLGTMAAMDDRTLLPGWDADRG